MVNLIARCGTPGMGVGAVDTVVVLKLLDGEGAVNGREDGG